MFRNFVFRSNELRSTKLLFDEESGEARFETSCFIRVDDIVFGGFIQCLLYDTESFYRRVTAHGFYKFTQGLDDGRVVNRTVFIVMKFFDGAFCNWHDWKYTIGNAISKRDK